METQTFWEIIGTYNRWTWWASFTTPVILAATFILSYKSKARYAMKIAMGIAHLFIGIAFFGLYGTEPIQAYFALPLFLACGVLFFLEAIINHGEIPRKPDPVQIVLLCLYALYPACSYALGHRFPYLVTYTMPCPIACLGLLIHSLYPKKNKLLLFLLTVWGLTGIKALFFNAYEDLILLLCGIYGVFLLNQEKHAKKTFPADAANAQESQ